MITNDNQLTLLETTELYYYILNALFDNCLRNCLVESLLITSLNTLPFTEYLDSGKIKSCSSVLSDHRINVSGIV